MVMGRLLSSAQKFNQQQVAQTVTMLLEHAYSHHATDIHIEPRERFVLVRYRIDGVLRGVHKLPLTAASPLTVALKELANIPDSGRDVPGEGYYDVTLHGQRYHVQVVTAPVFDGEKIVLRLKTNNAVGLPLEQLGLWGSRLESVRHALTATRGLILIASPARSGKTTTLYSLLHILTTPMLSVATVEDPIDHQLSGVSQTQLHPNTGVGFAEGLQAILNQDANIIMVSNLPDTATIRLAVQAATQSHLILAGTVSPGAIEAIAQLISCEVQPYILATSLRLVLAQRLVRRLCPTCKRRYKLDGDQQELLRRAFGLKNPAARRHIYELEQQAAVSGLGDLKQLSSTPSALTHLWQAHPEGCVDCAHTGYLLQVPLIEVLIPGEAIRTLLIHTPGIAELQTAATDHSFVPLAIDGLIKALRGLTSIEEVLRVI